ncbi:MAG: DUF2341 domain-containing protein [Kiritimatiellia bacterium]
MKTRKHIYWRAFSWARIPLFALAIGLLAGVGRSEMVDSGAFAYRSTILVSGYAGSTTLADFPLMVKLAENSPTGFSYAECEPATLRFADADGTIVPHEIDTWNTDGTSIVWVRVPELSGTATELTMYYGGSGDGVAINAGEVWSASGHNAVWHFSGNGNDSVNGLEPATVTGSPDYTNTDLGVGTAFYANGSSTIGFANDDKWATLGEGSCLTVSLWAKYDATSWNYARMISCMDAWTDAQGWEVTIQNAKDQITVGSSGQSQYQYTATGLGPCSANAYLTIVYHADKTAALYVNGELKYSKTLNQVVKPTKSLWIACCKGSLNYWNGKLDEIRIHRAEESADWIKACYDTMTSDSFVVLGEVEATGAETPLTIRINAPMLSGTEATISGRLANLGTGASSADVTLYYGTSEELEASGTAIGPVAYTDKADLTNTLTGLTPGATYYCAYKAVNDLGTVNWTETQSFTVEASTRVSDELAIAAENGQVTVTATLTEFGVGTTKLELLVNGESVQTIDLTEAPENMTVAFDSIVLVDGTYTISVRATTTYNDIVWVRESAETSQAVADSSTYTWKGGDGVWTDPEMWINDAVGASGIPGTSSSVVIEPTVASVVTLPSTKTFEKLYLSTKDAPVTIIGSLAAANIYMKSAENAYPLRLEGAVLGTKNAATSLKQVESADSISKLEIVKGSAIYLNSALAGACDFTLFDRCWLGTNAKQPNAGALKVGRGFSLLGGSWNFAKYEDLGHMGVVGVKDGAVSFADPSGIEVINGVAPGFAIGSFNGWANNRFGWGACRIDEEGVVRQITINEMVAGFDSAAETDNVYLSENVTLESDVTVNAVLIANNVTLNLGGYTLTLKSGVIRPQGSFGCFVKNGIVASEKPLMTFDCVNNTTLRFEADIVYAGEGEGVVAFTYQNGSRPALNQFTNFTGRVYWGSGATLTSAGFPELTLEFWDNGFLTANGHNETQLFKGMGGTFGVRAAGKFNEVYWIGSTNGFENLREKNRRFVVAPGGTLLLGQWWDDGFRKGNVRLSCSKDNTLMGIRYFAMLGGTLEATLRPDGEATVLDLLGGVESNPDNIDATLGGELKLIEAGKLLPGTKWAIIRTRTETTGYFENAGENGKGIPGYRLCYNVPQEDGTYACEITRMISGTFILVR